MLLVSLSRCMRRFDHIIYTYITDNILDKITPKTLSQRYPIFNMTHHDKFSIALVEISHISCNYEILKRHSYKMHRETFRYIFYILYRNFCIVTALLKIN